MRKVIIRASTRELFRQHTLPGHTLAAPTRTLPDGRVEITLEEDTWERLNERRLAGETDDALIERVVLMAGRRPQ